MEKLKWLAAAVMICFGSPSFALDAWDRLLEKSGLVKADLRFAVHDLAQVGGARLISPSHTYVHGEPLLIPFFARTFRSQIFNNLSKPTDLLLLSLQKVGLGIRRNLVEDPLKDLTAESLKKDSLFHAISNIHKKFRHRLTENEVRNLKGRVRAVPPEVAQIAAYLLLAELHAYDWHKQALASLTRKELQDAYTEILKPIPRKPEPETLPWALRTAIEKINLETLMVGGIDLVLGVDIAVKKLRDLKLTRGFRFSQSTPLGRIEIRRGGADTYPDSDYLLILDFDGDDTYHAGAGADMDHPVSILIDLDGHDTYKDSKNKRSLKIRSTFGAGVFGYGILVDDRGNDHYRSARHTQGRGHFGVGLLWDRDGNDSYDCWTQCQASAEFGAGTLVDSTGTDSYTSFQQSQGFGGPKGSGVLIDGDSNSDVYVANTTEIDFPALVDSKYNTSLAQGTACGYRSDYIDGYSLAGGFGALLDQGGDNQFTAGFFAQGTSYWYGVGLLSSGQGQDVYKAGKYAQGAATHFGVGILHDDGGHDRYEVDQELGIGHGHDFAVGFLLDDAGNDHYTAPNFSLGCASAQGIGIFWDKEGDDAYSSKEPDTLGCASLRMEPPSLRVSARTMGLFLDSGGRNTFNTEKLKGKKSSGSWKNQSANRLVGSGLILNDPKTPDPLPSN